MTTFDPYGFLWIASSNGLWKYDFVEFKRIPGTGGVYNSVYAIGNNIYSDSQNQLVIISNDRKDHHSILRTLKVEDDHSIFRVSSDIILHNADSLYSLAFNEKIFQGKFISPQIITELDKSLLLISPRGSISKLDQANNNITSETETLRFNDEIIDFLKVDSNRFWLIDDGITELRLSADGTPQSVQRICNFKWKPIKTWVSENNIFINTVNGEIYQVDPSSIDKKPRLLVQENEAYRSIVLKTAKVHDITEYYGVKIIGAEDGFYVCRPNAFINPSSKLPSLIVGSIVTDIEGATYTIMGGLLYKIKDSEEDPKVQKITSDLNEYYFASGYQNRLWLGTQDGRIQVWENDMLLTEYNVNDPRSIIFNIFRDSGGNVWFCYAPGEKSVEGVGRIDKDGRLRIFKREDGILSRSLSIDEGSDGTLYFGGRGPGQYLHIFDSSTQTFVNISQEFSFAHGLNFEIHDLVLGDKDTVWMASSDGLLMQIGNQVKRVDIGPFVPANTEIKSITLGPDGSLWLTIGTYGLFRYFQEDLVAFPESTGLVSKIVPYRSLEFDSLKRLWVGTVEGLSVSQPGPIIPLQTRKPIMLTSLDSLTEFLQEGGSEINLRFTCPSFPASTVSYQLFLTKDGSDGNQLYGLSNSWFSLRQSSEINISDLSSGSYSLKVRAKQEGGYSWSETQEFSLEIPPPWYVRPFAIVIYLVLLASVVLLIVRVNVLRLRRENLKLEKMVETRTSELTTSNNELHNQKLEIDNKNRELEVKSDEIGKQIKIVRNKNSELKKTINELKDTQKKLIESEKMASLGILSAGVAHEINNPLNFINGGILGLKRDVKNGDIGRVDDYLHAIEEGVKRASSIVTSLNRFSRQSENMEERCNVHETIDHCLLILRNKTKTRIEIVKEYVDKELIVEGNEGRMHQFILNILVNAIQAIKDKGTIWISTKYTNHKLILNIRDNGIGISKEIKPKIFDTFFTTKEPGEGTGMGLSITYSIIKEHGGTIDINSVEGEGTEVIVELPLLGD